MLSLGLDEVVPATTKDASRTKLREIDFECDSIFLVFDVRSKSDMKQLINSTIEGT